MSTTAPPTETLGDTPAATLAVAPPSAADAAAPDGPAESSAGRSFWLTLPAGFAASLLCHLVLVLWGPQPLPVAADGETLPWASPLPAGVPLRARVLRGALKVIVPAGPGR